jgi:general secretion pathway protein D
MLSGSPAVLEASLDALNLFDVDALQGKSVALVTLASAEPDAVVQELQTIFGAEQGGSLDGVIEFVPNNRLGSVLVISSRASYLDKARRWIRELDQSASQGSMILRTYPLNNRTAAEVAPILDGLFANGELGGESQKPEQSSESSGRPRIAADEARNALIVRAKGSDHTEIAAILKSLDTAARQVLLEATIAEVTLNDEVNIGTRWFFEKGNWGFRSSDLDTGAVTGNAPGFSAVFGAGGASVALSALASVTDVKVISSPTLMVVDNREGVLQIGDQVPIATQTSSATDETALAITQVSYRDTGIILTVLPRVGAGGRVSLDIEQEVSDVSATKASGIDSPTISTRRVSTSVVLSDGQTLALGGLVQERDNKGRTQLPGAGDIPVIGTLFGNRSSKKTRTELLILIRPRVVYDPSEANAATAAWRSKLGSTSSILQTGLGAGRHSVTEVLK